MLCLQYRLPGHSSSLSETHHSKITKEKFHSVVIYDMSEQLLKGLFEDPTWLGSVGTSTVSLAESILKFGNKWYLRWHFRSVGSSHLSPHKLSGMISVPGLPQVPGLFSGWDQWNDTKDWSSSILAFFRKCRTVGDIPASITAFFPLNLPSFPSPRKILDLMKEKNKQGWKNCSFLIVPLKETPVQKTVVHTSDKILLD